MMWRLVPTVMSPTKKSSHCRKSASIWNRKKMEKSYVKSRVFNWVHTFSSKNKFHIYLMLLGHPHILQYCNPVFKCMMHETWLFVFWSFQQWSSSRQLICNFNQITKYISAWLLSLVQYFHCNGYVFRSVLRWMNKNIHQKTDLWVQQDVTSDVVCWLISQRNLD